MSTAAARFILMQVLPPLVMRRVATCTPAATPSGSPTAPAASGDTFSNSLQRSCRCRRLAAPCIAAGHQHSPVSMADWRTVGSAGSQGRSPQARSDPRAQPHPRSGGDPRERPRSTSRVKDVNSGGRMPRGSSAGDASTASDAAAPPTCPGACCYMASSP